MSLDDLSTRDEYYLDLQRERSEERSDTELARLMAEVNRLRKVEAAAARYVREGLNGNYSIPGGAVARNQDYVALVEAVRTNPDFRG